MFFNCFQLYRLINYLVKVNWGFIMEKDILERLLTLPQRSQIKVEFDLKKQFFELSVLIYRTKAEMPLSLVRYVKAREGRTFKPHETSFRLEEGHQIVLVQKIPFQLEPFLRGEVDQFWQMAKQCHQMLSEMAIEERYHDALKLDM